MIRIYLLIMISVVTGWQAPSKKIQQPDSIHGVWVTNVGSDILLSKENIKKGIRTCKANGINTIYVVVWNNGLTMYPSQVLTDYIGVNQDAVYKGRDPIKEIIAEAHASGIQVHAWFEFGFAYAYKDSNNAWLRKYPHWTGKDVAGNLLRKNGFFWWNSLHPEVQEFMNKLVLEVVSKYNVDGVQGDDRLPAMPAEGGYDDYTLRLYAKENNGNKPPVKARDSAWLQWRADKLNLFAKELYKKVKEKKKGCTVSWAPSVYPWSKEQYLQDWPAWLEGDYADYILPQLYRYKYAAYESTLKELDKYVPAKKKNKIIPGMLTSLADGYLIRPSLLDSMKACNAKYGYKGEVLFYFEGLNGIK